MPKIMVLTSKSDLRSAVGFRVARKKEPVTAPIPIKLLIYPNVAASPLYTSFANTGNTVP